MQVFKLIKVVVEVRAAIRVAEAGTAIYTVEIIDTLATIEDILVN
jgi:hypothetical protein